MTSSSSKERLLSGPGGRPEADGQKVLDPEVLDSEVPMLVTVKRYSGCDCWPLRCLCKLSASKWQMDGNRILRSIGLNMERL